jgi:sulfopyruvate decarboxylase alpha subunit
MQPVGWQDAVFEVLKRARVRQVAFVPDSGHSRLITLAQADQDVRAIVLTTEEEGVALTAGAWLGGQRSVLLMQSSGVGNCINMMSLPINCRMPFLTLVTMRGEWGEFNPWQLPMGQATPAALGLAGAHVLRADRAEDAAETVTAASTLAFDGLSSVAVLFSQRLLGAKVFR